MTEYSNFKDVLYGFNTEARVSASAARCEQHVHCRTQVDEYDHTQTDTQYSTNNNMTVPRSSVR